MNAMVAKRYLKCNSESLVTEKVAGCYYSGMENRDIRLNNLKYAIWVCGSIDALAEKADCNKKYLEQIIQGFQGPKDKNPRSLGNQVAPKIAKAIGQPTHWIDQINGDQWMKIDTDIEMDLMPAPTAQKATSDEESELQARYRAASAAHQAIVDVVLGGPEQAPSWMTKSTLMSIDTAIQGALEHSPDTTKKSEPPSRRKA